MKRKISFLVVVLIVFACVASSCGGGITGTYKARYSSQIPGETFVATLELNANNSCTISKNVEGFEAFNESYSGTYSVEGSKLTLTLTWTDSGQNQKSFSGTVQKSGKISLRFFGQNLVFAKS